MGGWVIEMGIYENSTISVGYFPWELVICQTKRIGTSGLCAGMSQGRCSHNTADVRNINIKVYVHIIENSICLPEGCDLQ